jgi:hypothetical protein
VRYIVSETEEFSMKGEIEDSDTAIEIARDYADEECLGELGEVIDARRENKDTARRIYTRCDRYCSSDERVNAALETVR